MMMALLLLRSKLIYFYEKHYRVTRGVMKALVLFFSLCIIVWQMDYSSGLGQIWILALLAVLCGFTPDPVSIVVVCLMICAETFQVSVMLSGVLLTVLLIYYLLFGRLQKYSFYIVLAVPVLSAIHIGYVVPIVAALFVTPALLPALAFGVLFDYMMLGVVEYASATAGAEGDNTLSSIQYLFRYMVQNRLLFITVTAFVLAFICVYMIRRRPFKNAFQIAILAGALILMTIELLSNIILVLDVHVGILALQIVISMALAYVIQFFYVTLDYQGIKKLQFEDDEYYYYVTAVPKFKVAVVDRTVTKIQAGTEEEELEK